MRKTISWMVILFLLVVPLGGCSSNSDLPSQDVNLTNQTQNTNETVAKVGSTSTTTQPTYQKGTNTELKFEFLDCASFSRYWTNGIYRCGLDFPAGDYYIMSIFGANALYCASDSPNSFEDSTQRMLRKVSVENKQYVQIQYGGIMVPANEVDTSNWKKYGVFLVGEDLQEGDYRITSVASSCTIDGICNIQNISGAYQICDDSPEKEPIACGMLTGNQSYITVKNGQYLIINNLVATLCDVETDNRGSQTEAVIESFVTESTETTNSEITRLSIEDSKVILSEQFDKYQTLIDDYSEVLDYWKGHSFNKKDEIRTLESMWVKMGDKATDIRDNLAENKPPEYYDEIWNEFKECFDEIVGICQRVGSYDFDRVASNAKDEMYNDLFKDAMSEMLEKLQEVIDLAERLNNMPAPGRSDGNTETQAPENTVTPTTKPTHKCEECGKNAEYSMDNPFSGETEYYCKTHYDEIQGYISQIQGNDVSRGAKSAQNSSSTEKYNSARHTDSEAWSCAVDIVKNNLKAPSTAKFCSFNDGTVTHLGNGEYKVTGWVESQNSFGAMIRSNFIVTYTATARGYKNGVALIN